MLVPISPHKKTHPYLHKFCRRLRQCPTRAEKHMTGLLKSLRLTYVNQQVFLNHVKNVAYIADFWIPRSRLIIECDGAGHYTRYGRKRDRLRDRAFISSGIRTLRLPNSRALKLTSTTLALLLRP